LYFKLLLFSSALFSAASDGDRGFERLIAGGGWQMEVAARGSPKGRQPHDCEAETRVQHKGPGDAKTQGTSCSSHFFPYLEQLKKNMATPV